MQQGPYRPAFDPEAPVAELEGTAPENPRARIHLSLHTDRIEERSRRGGVYVRRTIMLGADMIIRGDGDRVWLSRGRTSVEISAADPAAAHLFCSRARDVARDLAAPAPVSIMYSVRRDLGYLVAALCSMAGTPSVLLLPCGHLTFDLEFVYFVLLLPVVIGVIFAAAFAVGRDRRLIVEHGGTLQDLPASATHYRRLVDRARSEARA
jgi:hypothetical protein